MNKGNRESAARSASGLSSTIVIQARTNSSRLPGKALRRFRTGETLLERVLAATLQAFAPASVVVATTTSASDEPIVDTARAANVRVHRGAEDDVLGRILDSLREDGADFAVRVCADNPFISAPHLRLLVDLVESADDYLSYALDDGTPSILSHLGLFGEIISTQALQSIHNASPPARWREHATLGILEQPQRFRCRFLELPRELRGKTDLRFTVDTENDFAVADTILAASAYPKGGLTLERLVHVAETTPGILSMMEQSILAQRKG